MSSPSLSAQQQRTPEPQPPGVDPTPSVKSSTGPTSSNTTISVSSTPSNPASSTNNTAAAAASNSVAPNGALPSSGSTTAPKASTRHRPPMLKLENKSNLKTSPPTGGSSSGFAGVNLSHLNRNSATTTTTLLSANPTPSTGVFPALRTPKDIVLQDIAVQCISPALPSFGSSVMDAMARSKTIQEEQRKLIAERRRLNGDSDNDADDDDAKNNQTEKQIIVSENSNVIIESVPTPTETRLQYHPSALKDHNRKPRPKKIELFPYHKGPSIRSAPIINNAAAAARRVYVQPPHRSGGPQQQQQQLQQLQQQQHFGGRASLARQWPIREEELSDDSDESMRDPEDAALSDSDVETKAIAEEDELMAARRKRKREKTFAKLVQSAVDVAGAPKPRPLAVHHPVPHQALPQPHQPQAPQEKLGRDRKRQRFLELCGELWDMFNE
ncbi:hypothetical protein D0Z00_003103 [Geotrichum galactomycetum]|uniref:Uncharacterized protein n=1 Tax=Geotrichum galactomycetum TaxID=27317 RepID=A0ACB6V259_9ASCO|nr:hypothetical protein D0Z00_003103 [Geotrichum candidum]